MDAPEQLPPSTAASSEIEEQRDVSRLQRLPPLEYERMNRDQRLAFIQWYQQTLVCQQIFDRYPRYYLEGIFDAYPTEEPADTPLKESLAGSFKFYLQQTWFYKGKQLPQPASYFLLHKRFSRLIDQGIYLPTHMDMVPALLFSLQEVNQIKTQGLQSIVTAVGSKELHFHEVGTVYPNDKEKLFIYLKQNASYFLSANKEFMKQGSIEVWFRRAKEGIPNFIFCPAVSARIPLLSFPLSTPGEPEVVLELSHLEAMPALHLERFSAKHKSDFYQWLLTKDEFLIRDDDPESLDLVADLFHLYSNDFHIANSNISSDEVARLCEEYVQERWSTPSKELPEKRAVYLFEKKFELEDCSWIWLPPELMQQAASLILTTEECNQFAKSKTLCVVLSITTSTMIKFEKQVLLVKEGTSCKIAFFERQYTDIFSHLSGH